MKELLNRLINHETISREEAKQVIFNISEGKYSEMQIAAFLTVYMMRSVTIEELEGFRDALLELCIHVDLSEFDPVDLCGTGGDSKNTFNISTTSSFVTAGAGVKVAKHGNYGVSSVSGSSNVMESLGIKFSSDESFLKKCIEEANICILHAPLFHPAMKNVAPVRKGLAVKTFFNMLGPMVNPAFPKNQLVGVFSLEMARMYAYLYQNTDKNYTILHALDGYDEISLTGETKCIRNNSESMLKPSDFGVSELKAEEIAGGGSVESSAEILVSILKGEGSEAQTNVVCANAGMAIATSRNLGAKEGFEQAREAISNGKAYQSFKKLQELSKI
ncbi:anthranilate phosphoribosyltransferase [Christiangramia fulva]|uniref:Anthranilate phosphoribosyltransferase n=1 Tax=Christiangramia fulva TaxID=2126553 RepID=A0A2R3Z170_9FLAO|nr:anthranilate phosphoribosyltransferase [Christiangramia fulva]AVR44011.1 anthranilate phosphoribosyltransferase [Christiangramia fulva]